MLAQAMATDAVRTPAAVNFGPEAESFRSVAELVQAFTARWDGPPDGGLMPTTTRMRRRC